jgi:3-hydroxyanthranilate 3,4-dioxygenase
MDIRKPLNLKKWIDENRHLLKPPVGNQVVYKENKDFIVMVVGGPNSRKDFHYNESEELFYQLEGTIHLRIIQDEKVEEMTIEPGDLFLLPPKVPHCPQRPANTVGLVLERHRQAGERDGFLWFCESCGEKLYEEYIDLKDIVKELPEVMNRFYSSTQLRTCKKCGTVMEPPAKI